MELPLFCLDPSFLFCDDGVRGRDPDSNPSLADASRLLGYRYCVEYGPRGNTICMGSEGKREEDGEVPAGNVGRVQEKWPILRDCVIHGGKGIDF